MVADPPKFKKDDWVVPLKTSLYSTSSRGYRIAESMVGKTCKVADVLTNDLICIWLPDGSSYMYFTKSEVRPAEEFEKPGAAPTQSDKPETQEASW